MIADKETPADALEYLRQLSWGQQMLWLLSALFSLQRQLDEAKEAKNEATAKTQSWRR